MEDKIEDPTKSIEKFYIHYQKHYLTIIKAIGTLHFSDVESIWYSFWQSEMEVKEEGLDDEEFMSMDKLKDLTRKDTPLGTFLSDWIVRTDFVMYSAIISRILLPNLLRPIPQQLTQQIRNFAKNITNWMSIALKDYNGKSNSQLNL